MPLWGGIEAGGTKFLCAVGTSPDDLRAEVRFPTTTPHETIGRTIAFFEEQQREQPLAALGIASPVPANTRPDEEKLNGTTPGGAPLSRSRYATMAVYSS